MKNNPSFTPEHTDPSSEKSGGHSLGERTGKTLRKYGLNIMLIIGGTAAMKAQTDPTRAQNELQVTEINAIGGANFDAQGESVIEPLLYRHAREMQNAYGVHIDLVNIIVRVRYISSNLISTGSSLGDLAQLRGWRQNSTNQATHPEITDPRDLTSSFYTGNAYTGAAQSGPGDDGFRYQTIAAPTLTWLLAHEAAHGLDGLNGSHTEAKTNITFTATNIATNAQSNLDSGYTVGNVASTPGILLQYYTVSNANNTGNPIHGGDGNTRHVGEYFGEDHEISTPYTELDNGNSDNVADGIAAYYNGTGPGQSVETEPVIYDTAPTANVAGNSIDITNEDQLETGYANTTNASFGDQLSTPGVTMQYLYLATDATDGSPIAGPTGLDETFDNLAPGDYKIASYDATSNSLSPFSDTFTITTLSIDNNQEIEGFKMYPNPATTEVTLSITKGQTIKTIEIFSSNGRLISQVSPLSLNEKETIDISNLASGMYIVIATNQDGRTSTEKLLKK
ncbi:secreted protein with Por secretion system C-terminal sorting domain [Psychroflexus torquis ATCC 700755]|uniref:Secreted protein with Por secretion system C-terminal sorting domain n=1 Tax=Psychroflexus torquis (strain ATCC 700755 / CIP 106069 / ACAM 623) TaxID=313595 RepID=K4IB34_PSYTT|nr:T9SS type A sorting domain-containing protein [Psychroflexus torquis]AFU67822.1 secreted protein with Por secretion system C-terminal sorting domain [Psychroflexus torquis ATCC 700755]